LLILTGLPGAGKTTHSNALVASFASRIAASSDPRICRLKIEHINIESLAISRTVYANANSEKTARAAEMTAIKRALGPRSIVIADGLNYVKGFRYQLFCEAKAARQKHCVLYVGTSVATCRSWNDKRQDGYPPQVFEELVMRFEEPTGMARWDRPLFTVVEGDDTPTEAIWNEIVEGSSFAPVRPNASTVLVRFFP